MVRDGQSPLNEFLRIDDALAEAVATLDAVSESPRLDAELILARALDVPRSYLFAHPEDRLDRAAAARFFDTIRERASGRPMAYIAGEKEFWSMTLMVSPATLVPRTETEILVEQALMRLPRHARVRILDLGTGTGAIALAMARERPACLVVATDISEAALAVAQQNARQLDIPNVEFLAGDWVDPVRDRQFELVVSNPPYIAAGDPSLARLRHEPRHALVAGKDGLDAVRRIAAEVPAVLMPGGTLLLEHGAEQADAVAAILRAAGWTDVTNVSDLAGLPRVTIAAAAASASVDRPAAD